ncbi:hypothetical protein EIP91_012010 [Steccherinum ochraceum]|uniref:Uncharacterized protein n=1 Tax=Steccherinum ochraceum TaxID=92696 RepID=A0A4R0RL87_9APHY|nr:hypothetical protein EIP91_012010 [Steccherinum ochraceum]
MSLVHLLYTGGAVMSFAGLVAHTGISTLRDFESRLLESSSAFEAASLPPAALYAAPPPGPTTSSLKSTQSSVFRSAFTPSFVLIVTSAILCASVPYVLSHRRPDQCDHSIPSVASQPISSVASQPMHSVASQHRHVSVREPQDSLVTVEVQETPSNDELEPEVEPLKAVEIIAEKADNDELEPEVQPMKGAEIIAEQADNDELEPEVEPLKAVEVIDEQADNREEIEESTMQDVPQVQTLEIEFDLEITEDSADGTEDVEEMTLNNNTAQPMEIEEVEKGEEVEGVIVEQPGEVEELFDKNAPQVDTREMVDTREIEEVVLQQISGSELCMTRLAQRKAEVAATVRDDAAPPDTPITPATPLAAPEAFDESGPSSGPKRRRGKRGGVRSETARRRKNAERAELRAYDLYVDDEDDEEDGEEDYPTLAPEAVDEPESGPSTGPKRRRGKRGGVRSETTRRRKNAERAELRAYNLNVDDEDGEEDY